MLIGWLLCERRAQTKTAHGSDLADEAPEKLIYVYPRIKAPKKLILLYYVLALLFFGAMSFYVAVTTVICPSSQ